MGGRRAAAGGDDKPVVTHRRSARGAHDAGESVNPDYGVTDPQVDVVLGVPVERIEEDPVEVIGAGKHIGQQDSVVVAVGLVSEDGDVEKFRAVAAKDLLYGADTGHSITDDDQPRFPGWWPSGVGRGEVCAGSHLG